MVDRYAEVLLDWHEAVGHVYDVEEEEEPEPEPEPAAPVDESPAGDGPSAKKTKKATDDTPEDAPGPASTPKRSPKRPAPPKRAAEP